MRTHDKFSRRRFLQAVGAGPALLPMLEGDLARADCIESGRKRLVVVHWGNGLEERATGSGASFTLPDIMSPLGPHRANLIIPDAITNKTFADIADKDGGHLHGHGSCPSLLIARPMPRGTAPTPSLDYFIGTRYSLGSTASFAVLNLAVMFAYASPAWQSAAVSATPDDDPYHAFDRIFGGRLPGTNGTPQMDTVRAVRRSVLDYVRKDLARFSRKLGTDDRARMDGHLTSIREIEGRLMPPPLSAGCRFPTMGAKLDVHASDNYERTLRAQIDLGVAALAAGLSQVLTLHATSGDSGHYVATWLGQTPSGVEGEFGDTHSHHDMAHAGGAAKKAIDTWFFSQLAYLIGQLKAAKEGNASIFDNTVVLVTNNMDRGNGHHVFDLPWLVAGSAGGYFKTGRLIAANNASHTQLLVGICNAFGAPPEAFADPAYGGELPGLRG